MIVLSRVVIFCLAVTALCKYSVCLDNQELGWQPFNKSRRIIGGEDALEAEIPYQILLRWNGDWHCGGSLIELGSDKKQAILTAAHCLHPFAEPTDLTVVAGKLKMSVASGWEQSRRVTRVIRHEEYNPRTFANDIAILMINRPFNLNSHIAPIPLPPKLEKETTGKVLVSGWGVTEYGTTADTLQKVSIAVVPDKRCQEMYAHAGVKILPSMLCAAEVNKDSCQGDSGGPLKSIMTLKSEEYLAGIVSFGIGCADPNFPGVNTEVSYFLDWINSHA